MRTLVFSVAVVLLVSLLTVLVILRRSGHREPDLLASHLRALDGSGPDPVRRPATASGPGFPPGFHLDPHRPAGPREPAPDTPRAEQAHELLRRVRELADDGRRAEAVRLLRDVTAMSDREAGEAVARLVAPPPH
ncbi:hypothetical protein [Actinoplanes sp. NPDC049118]|uniref:hypothetical protein n=1 Tax=Actinoplanes sp. NPDC049118 TaxID=3155769 RepID=UPI0033C5E1DD